MAAKELIEKHMRELQDSLATLVADRTSEHTQHIEALQNELSERDNTIAYLRAKNRDLEADVSSIKQRLWSEKESHGRGSPVLQQSSESRVVCLIDGDGCLFSYQQLGRGYHGGAHVAKRLTEGVQQYFASEQCQLHVWVFFHNKGVSGALQEHGHRQAASNLTDFMHGFNQASVRFMMVDVGPGKEAADVKIRALLDEELKSPHTRRVILAGCHDGGYVSAIREHMTSGLTDDRLFLLPAHKTMAAGYRSLGLPNITISDVFEQQRLDPLPKSAKHVAPLPAPTPSAGAKVGKATTPSLPTPAASPGPTSDISAVQPPSSAADHSPGHDGQESPSKGPRAIDPTRPITKQVPTPCHFFYVAKNCKHGDKCLFSHDYELSAEHVAQMKEAAEKSKSPCPTLNRGDVCPHGDRCVWAHKCAYTTRCQYHRVGRCRFTGPGMHSAE